MEVTSRTCKNCKETKPSSEFYRNKTALDGMGNICKACKRVRDGEYRDRHRERLRAKCRARHAANPEEKSRYSRNANRRLREEVLAAYGRVCACCGEDTYEFLTLDHIDGGGSDHRRAVNRKVYKDVKRRGFPPGYRILCWNCNCARGRYGFCPHEINRSLKIAS